MSAVTVPELRRVLGLPSERPEFVRDLLAVERSSGVNGCGSLRLALGDWPDAWRAEPSAAPRFLVVLHRLVIAVVQVIDVSLWGSDVGASPDTRLVPVTGTVHAATAQLAGKRLDCADLSFAWPRSEEQFEFL
jgi:hypothetical protein